MLSILLELIERHPQIWLELDFSDRKVDLVAASRACRSGHRVDTCEYASADVARGKLVPVLESFWPPPVPVQLLYPTSRHLAPQVRAAVELLMDRFTV